MRLGLFIILMFFSSLAFAQVRISGRVVDEQTKQGISSVSVYLNNSTYGGVTDDQGNFSFTSTLSGKATLIVSHIAYARQVHIVEDGKTENLEFSLKFLENKLNEVVIRSKKHSKADLTRWINLFSENLIGKYVTKNHLLLNTGLRPGINTSISNVDALYFDFDDKENNLKVYAREPLVVVNDFLAYSIKIDLEQFEYNFNSNEVIFKYYAFYEDLKSGKLSAAQIKKNRLLAYEGSSMHFMRSVFLNNLGLQHFYVYKYSAIRNKERDRVERIIRQKIAGAYAKEESPDVALSRFFRNDTLNYYRDLLKQDEILSFKTTPVDVRPLTKKDRATRTVNLNFGDTILVNYDKAKLKPEKMLPTVTGKANTEVPKPVYLSTYMYFFNEGGINIQRNGYYQEMSLFMWGDMPERRIGVSLPFDYEPD